MDQIWKDDKRIAVTRVEAGPCFVIQIKNNEKDGYSAVQIGFGERKEKNIKKPQKDRLNKLKIKSEKPGINIRHLREFRIDALEAEKLKVGDKINAGVFEEGDKVKITGISKGRGFQGVVKRHGFAGSKATHGNKDQLRMPGSIGATGPAHVFKGTRMPGRMGGDRVATANLEIVGIEKDNNILLVKGAIAGARNGLLLIKGSGELKVEESVVKEEKKEEIPKNTEDSDSKDSSEQKLKEDKPKEKENSEVVSGDLKEEQKKEAK